MSMKIDGNLARKRWQGALKASDVKLHRPHPRLLKRLSTSPSASLHGKANRFFQSQIIAARQKVQGDKNNFMTLVFGPNAFEDFPLTKLLEDGVVVGLDINFPAMREARKELNPQQKGRLIPLRIDASLLVSKIIEESARVMGGGSGLTEEVFRDLLQRFDGLTISDKLPFENQSMDMVVSISCASQFITGAFNGVASVLDQYVGQRASNIFFSEKVTDGDQVLPRGAILAKRMNMLFRKITRAHVKEMMRIVRQKGIVFFSDHAMSFDGWPSDSAISVYTDRVRPIDMFMHDIQVESDRDNLRLAVGERSDAFRLVGKDSLLGIVEGINGIEIVDEFSLLNINRIGNYMLQVPASYFLDTILVLRPA